jgi:hypothetical protein
VAGRSGGDTMVTYLKFTVPSSAAGLNTGVTVKSAQVVLTRESKTLPNALTIACAPGANGADMYIADRGTVSSKVTIANCAGTGARAATVKIAVSTPTAATCAST